MTIYNIFALCGGLGLFIYGMSMMSEGFEKAAGDRLRDWLSILTSKRIFAILVGAGVTAIIQSSSATTVMVVGFVNSSIMSLQQAIGVIMGASIGTTITGYIVALNMGDIAPLFAFIGVVMVSFIKKRQTRRVGLIFLGFGILFMGMDIMSGALEPLRSSELFRQIIITMENPILGVLAGTAITAIIQSSSAFSGICIALAGEGLLGIEAAVPLIMGANIGTCATALLASIGTSTNAKRAATMHLIYKVIGAAVFLVVLQFVPVAELLSGALDTAKAQVVAFNTLYNIFNCVVLYPFANKIVGLTCKLIPEKAGEAEEEQTLMYIDSMSLSSATLIIPQLKLEVQRMKELAVKNLRLSVDCFMSYSPEKEEQLRHREGLINYLNHQLTNVLVRASSMHLSDDDRRIIGEMYHIIPDLERIGDHAENILEYAEFRVEKKVPFSEAALQELQALTDAAVECIEKCWIAYIGRDQKMFPECEQLEQRVDDLYNVSKEGHIARMNAGNCDPYSSTIFTDMIGDLERTADHAINMLVSITDNMLK